jgi:hypothetical protein
LYGQFTDLGEFESRVVDSTLLDPSVTAEA